MTKTQSPQVGQIITIPAAIAGRKRDVRFEITKINEFGTLLGHYLTKAGKPSGSRDGGVPMYGYQPSDLGL